MKKAFGNLPAHGLSAGSVRIARNPDCYRPSMWAVVVVWERSCPPLGSTRNWVSADVIRWDSLDLSIARFPGRAGVARGKLVAEGGGLRKVVCLDRFAANGHPGAVIGGGRWGDSP